MEMNINKSGGVTLIRMSFIIVGVFAVVVLGYFVVEKIVMPRYTSISGVDLDGGTNTTDIRYVNNSIVTSADKVIAVVSTSTQAGSKTGALTLNVLKNATYGGLVFVNGKNDKSFRCSVDGAYWGDLNEDSLDDAVVVVGCVGAGYSASLYPVLNKNNLPFVLDALVYGHNNNPHGDFASISIASGTISVVSDARFQNDKHSESFVILSSMSKQKSWPVQVGDSSFASTTWSWKDYVDSRFSFSYPSFAIRATVPTQRSSADVSFSFPNNFIPHTNLTSAYFSISSIKTTRSVDCLQIIPQTNLKTENPTINGVKYSIATYDEGAAGSSYHNRTYVNYNTNTSICTSATLVARSFNDIEGHNTDHPDDLVVAYKTGTIDQIFDQIMATFAIL